MSRNSKYLVKVLTKIPVIGKYGAVASLVTFVLIASGGVYGVSAVVGHYEQIPAKTISSPVKPVANLQQSESTTNTQPSATTTDSSNLSNNNYYTNSVGNTVHSPAYSNDGTVPAGATGLCNDGTFTFSQTQQGSCSSHGGVNTWIGPATTYSAPAPTCNQDLKSSYTNSYHTAVNAENITNQNNLANIQNYANSRGMLYSGYVTEQDALENQRHQTVLTNLLSTYNQQLASIYCM